MGYVYIYKQPKNWRNSGLMAPLTLPWFLAKAVNRVYCWFVQYRPSIYDEIGFTRYFARDAEAEKHPHPRECERIDIRLGNRALKKEGITTLEGLERWVKGVVSRRVSDKPLLVCIRVNSPARVFYSMMDSISDSVDNLDLQPVYFEQRRERRRKSVFPGEGLKTLVHIRLGDVAAVRTPWKTWIVREKKLTSPFHWKEFRNESEFGQLTVADFYHFIQGLNARFDDNTFALSIFSDGFERFFNEACFCNNHLGPGFGLLRKQMKALLKRRWDCARELRRLKEIKNSVSIIGEGTGKLVKLIDAVHDGELLIVAVPGQATAFRMTEVLGFSAEKPPAVFLYKPVAEEHIRRFLEDNSSAKIIPVDVSAPDFDGAAVRLVEFLPQLAPFLRSQGVRP